MASDVANAYVAVRASSDRLPGDLAKAQSVIASKLGASGSAIRSGLTSAITGVTSSLAGMTSSLAGRFVAVGSSIRSGLTSSLSGLKSSITGIASSLTGMTSSLAGRFVAVGSAIRSSLTGSFVAAGSAINSSLIPSLAGLAVGAVAAKSSIAGMTVPLAGLGAAGAFAKSSLASLLAPLAGIVAVGGAAAGVFFSIREAMNDESDMVRLKATLTATGHAAGFTADQLGIMAENINKTTAFSADAARGAQIVLLRFGQIRGDIFQGALDASSGLAALMGTDLPQAAHAVGLALEDPETGMRALRQAGIHLDDAQKELIKTFQETGQVGKAQSLVLDLIKEKTKGVAQAMAETTQGKWDKLKVDLAEIAESIGTMLLPAIRGAADVLRTVIAWFNELDKTAEKVWLSIQLEAVRFRDGLSDIWDLVAAGAAGAWSSMLAGAVAAWKSIQSVFGSGESVSIGAAMAKGFSDGFDNSIKRSNIGPSQLFNDLKRERDRLAEEINQSRLPQPVGPSTPKPFAGEGVLKALKTGKIEIVGIADLARKIQESLTGGSMIDVQKGIATETKKVAAATKQMAQNTSEANTKLDKIAGSLGLA